MRYVGGHSGTLWHKRKRQPHLQLPFLDWPALIQLVGLMVEVVRQVHAVLFQDFLEADDVIRLMKDD